MADLMLLVAATALGIMGVQNCGVQMRAGQIMPRDHLASAMTLVAPLPMCWSLALIAARLIPPRPPRRELFRQPGFAASCVMVLFMGMAMWQHLALNFNNPNSSIGSLGFAFFWPLSEHTGLGIFVAWMTLALAGCWQPEPGWLDRAGRVFGVFWIVAFLAHLFAWWI